MEYNNSQYVLFCLVLMLATLGYALYRINSASKRGESVRESPAQWAILTAFVICGLAFVNVAMDGYNRHQAEDEVAVESVHKVEKIVELGTGK